MSRHAPGRHASGTFLSGLLAASPLVPGLMSVGVLYGVTATAAGMPPWTVVATSLLVATGTAQFMAVELLGQGTAWWLVVATGLLVNLRFAVYALHLGSFVRRLPAARRWLYFAVTSDEGYALTAPLVDGDRPALGGQVRWSAGVMAAVWLPWQVGTWLGAGTGAVLPAALGLRMAVPVTLLVVLALLVTSARHVAVALAAGVAAVLLRDAPLNLGFLAGIAVGVATGLAVSASAARRPCGGEGAA